MKNKLILLAAVLFVDLLGGCGNSPDEIKEVRMQQTQQEPNFKLSQPIPLSATW